MGIFIAMLPISIHAQWYTHYGVKCVEELSEDQCKAALIKAKNLTSNGKFCTVFAGIGVGLGSAILIFPDNSGGDWDWDSGDSFEKLIAALCIGGGSIFGAIGIPAWITGKKRSQQIGGLLSRFPAKVSLNPYYSRVFNNHSTGLTLSVSF